MANKTQPSNVRLAISQTPLSDHNGWEAINRIHDSLGILGGQFDSGTFTPTISFGGASVGVVYGTQVATWYRTQKLIYYCINIVTTNKGVSVGNARLGSLPFLATNNLPEYTGSIWLAGLVAPAGNTHVQSFVLSNSTDILLSQIAIGGGFNQNLTDANFNNFIVVRATGFYEIDPI